MLVDDGLATAFKDAQFVRKLTCTPEPSAFMPLWSCPPANVAFEGVRTPVYARRSQRSDKKLPLPSCPPKIYQSGQIRPQMTYKVCRWLTRVSEEDVREVPTRASEKETAVAP